MDEKARRLLNIFRESMEEQGITKEQCFLNMEELLKEAKIKYEMNKHTITEQDIEKAIKYCIANEYLKQSINPKDCYRMTTSGFRFLKNIPRSELEGPW